MRMVLGSLFFFVWLFASDVFAGKYNEVLSIGDPAPAWKELPDAVTGKPQSLADLKDARVVVVVFTCNSCPVATDYEDRILKFAAKHSIRASGKDPKSTKRPAREGQVALVAINVNKVKDDLPAAMKERAQKKQYPFPYLFDETQKVARDYGALFTPEFFVLDQNRRVVYMGAMDDNADVSKVTQNYLDQAVAAALAGKQPETAETLATGCRIRYGRQRR
jgi:peroxiredoxin